jgi:hypothetical protein
MAQIVSTLLRFVIGQFHRPDRGVRPTFMRRNGVLRALGRARETRQRFTQMVPGYCRSWFGSYFSPVVIQKSVSPTKSSILRRVNASALFVVSAWSLISSAQVAPVPVNATWNQPAAAGTWSQVIARTTNRVMADLVVDGKPICRLPCQATLPSGAHRVVGRGPEGSSAEQTVYFAPGATVPILLDVMPPRGALRVSSVSQGTLIYVDGVLVGNTNWEGAVMAGPHQVQLRRPTGEALQQNLTVAAGMTYSIRDNAPVRPPVPPPTPAPVALSPQRPAAPPAASTPPPMQAQPAQTPPPYQGQPAQTPPPYQGQPAALGPSDVPPAPAKLPSPDDERYKGVTGALFAPIMLGGASTNDYGDHCPATAFGGYCTTSGPRGGAIAARIGYAFGWIAPEFMAALSLDLSSGGMHLPNDAKFPWDPQGMLTLVANDTKFMRVGILGGIGARMATQGRNSRFTFSGTFGLVKRHVYIIPDSFFGQKPSYTAKTLFFDTGIMLGDSPGMKFYAGLFLWLEFVPTQVITRDVTKLSLVASDVPDSLKTITPFKGTQVMFGPLVGLTFGH